MAKLKSGTRIYGTAIVDTQATFTSGPVLVGSASSTGSVSQPLQVTGGAYVSGNLGVGNINPGAKLDVSGDVRLSAADPEIEFNSGGPRLKCPSANTLTIHSGGGLNTASSEIVRINSTGVGIGTNNPTASLHVIGQAQLARVAITTTATNITMIAGRTYPYYSSITLTLPASPTAGDKVEIINRSNTSTAVIARNGRNIMGLAENMTIDLPDVGFTLIYANLADGWIIGK